MMKVVTENAGNCIQHHAFAQTPETGQGDVPMTILLNGTAISHMLGVLDAFQLRPFSLFPPSSGPLPSASSWGPHGALRR